MSVIINKNSNMKKYILIAFGFSFLLASNVACAGLLVTDDMKVPEIDFNGGKTEMTILKDSETEYFFVSKGSFTVTNPISKNGFNVASSNKEVKTILLTSEDNKVVSCALNEKPGESFLHINNLKGKYNIVPSKIEDCSKAFSSNKVFKTKFNDSDVVLASFWDDMSEEQKEKLLLELGKIALIIIVGQVI